MYAARPTEVLGVVLALSLGAARSLCAMDLKVWTVPLSLQSYERIDLDSVHAESLNPETEWLDHVKEKNGDLIPDLNVFQVATIEITRYEDSDPIDSFEPYILEGRQAAAKAGANALYLEKCLMDGSQLIGLRFVAYRIEYLQLVVSPTYLAALPTTSVYENLMVDQLLQWEDKHFGKIRVVLDEDGKRMTIQKVVGFLGTVKKGAPIRVLLRDGSDVKGTYNGLDDDDDIWIRPEGWIGFIADRSLHVRQVQSIGLLN